MQVGVEYISGLCGQAAHRQVGEEAKLKELNRGEGAVPMLYVLMRDGDSLTLSALECTTFTLLA